MLGLWNSFLETNFANKIYNANPKVWKNQLGRVIPYISKWREFLNFGLKSDAWKKIFFKFNFLIF